MSEREFTVDSVNVNLSKNTEDKVRKHRADIYQFLNAHYVEVILAMRRYHNAPASLDTLQLEYFLRSGYAPIVGENALGQIQVLGYATSYNNITVPYSFNMVGNSDIAPGDINWTVPKELIPKKPESIKRENGALRGNYIVMVSKDISLVNDFATVDLYASRMAELGASIYSLEMQAKFSTVLQFENGDAGADEIINHLYNGAAYFKIDDFINPTQQILNVGDSAVGKKLEDLKKIYSMEEDELKNILGLNSAGIQKSSGVSQDEVDSNNDAVQASTNIYLSAVNRQLRLLNERYDTEIYATLNGGD